jgi:hypothetical protein
MRDHFCPESDHYSQTADKLRKLLADVYAERDTLRANLANPTAILTLLARVQRLETLEQAAREWRSAWLPYQRPARRLASNDALCAAIDALTTTEPKP